LYLNGLGKDALTVLYAGYMRISGTNTRKLITHLYGQPDT